MVKGEEAEARNERRNERVLERLLAKAQLGNTSEVLAALDDPKNKDHRLIQRADRFGRTLLIKACAGGHPQLAQCLLDRGADVNARNIDLGWDALMLSAANGHVAVCALLIERGANIHSRDVSGYNALFYASANGHVAVCRLLLKNGANVHARDDNGNDALTQASRWGHIQVVKVLLEEGKADIHARNIRGMDALMCASYHGHAKVCSQLLDFGADPDHIYSMCSPGAPGGHVVVYHSPLSLAATRDHVDVCLTLLAHGANLMLLVRGRTALDLYGKGVIKPRKMMLERRKALRAEWNWARRWPFLNVMSGCGFRPLASCCFGNSSHSVVISRIDDNINNNVVHDTSDRRRSYLMGLIFSCDGLLRLIVLFV